MEDWIEADALGAQADAAGDCRKTCGEVGVEPGISPAGLKACTESGEHWIRVQATYEVGQAICQRLDKVIELLKWGSAEGTDA